MRRRQFIAVLGGATVAWPLAVSAQSDRVRRIGMLISVAEDDPEGQARLSAFRQGLEKLGWTEGRNAWIDVRWRITDPDRARMAAKELVGLAPDVILASSTIATAAAKQATTSVPIVFTVVSEPVGQGFVHSLARPGGNITGFTNLEPSIGGKWLELLKAIAPHLARVTVMSNPNTATLSAAISSSVQATAQNFAVEPVVAPVYQPSDIEAVLAREPGGGLIVPPDLFTNVHRKLIIALAERYRRPAIYSSRYFVPDGGLMSYGVDLAGSFRQAATYVDRILRGEKPADLPVQQPTTFQFAINLKTATALGLAVPPALLAAADEIID